MHPRYVPTVDQFSSLRHLPSSVNDADRRSIRRFGGSIMAVAGQIARDRSPARGRLRPPAEFPCPDR
jgi:hypothetical protein